MELLKFFFQIVTAYDLSEDKREKKRYVVDLDSCSHYFGWKDKGNGYACYPIINIDGEDYKVAFFQNKFDHPETFSTEIRNVSFEANPSKAKGQMLYAENIHDEDSAIPYEEKLMYYAEHIRRHKKPGWFLYNSRMYFVMCTMFAGKNSFYDAKCPASLRDAFEAARKAWIKMFYDCDVDFIQMRIFNLMSLVADDLGQDYYDIAQEYLYNYMVGKGKLPDYIGYAVGNCTKPQQKSLLNNIFAVEKEKAVCILSKSIWGVEDFIWNVPVAKILEYFDAAIDYLEKLCYKGFQNPKDITMCLEYILGAFRLRKYNDHGVNRKLSLNNPKVQKLYELVEQIVERDIKIKSFLNLNVENKGIYDRIPNLVYAILMYITGEKGTGDISIAGIDSEDLDVEMRQI